MSRQNQINGPAHHRQRWIVEFPLGKDRCKAGGRQHDIAITEGDIKFFRQSKQHLAAWERTTVFEKTDVTSGDVCLEREFHLAEPASLPPTAE